MISLELLNKVTDRISTDPNDKSDKLLPLEAMLKSKMAIANIQLASDKGINIKDLSVVSLILVITQMSFIVGYGVREEEEKNVRAETHSHIPSE